MNDSDRKENFTIWSWCDRDIKYVIKQDKAFLIFFFFYVDLDTGSRPTYYKNVVADR